MTVQVESIAPANGGADTGEPSPRRIVARRRTTADRPNEPRSVASSALARATRVATPTSACSPARAAAIRLVDRAFLTVERLRELLPETADLEIERHDLANLWSLNFVIHDLLEEGVAASSRIDAQAKSLGEWLRARVVDVPVDLL